jgi:Holliday junction DNA helicase RuvA
MIAQIQGKLISKSIESVVVDVGGVGYEVFVPLTTYYRLPDIHQIVSLMIYTHHREDAIRLYGFLTPAEKEMFEFLISISGVGPKLARNILSGIDAEELTDALVDGDLVRIRRIPGVGSKTAERLVLELREKVQTSQVAGERMKGDGKEGLFKDVLSALINLGYKPQQADSALSGVKRNSGNEISFEVIFKMALKILAKG